ncbi:MAG: leucine-rich repeat protein [Clostridia bacterium]|nr:leucine-rich repeat protein [Clostridia bacterium]
MNQIITFVLNGRHLRSQQPLGSKIVGNNDDFYFAKFVFSEPDEASRVIFARFINDSNEMVDVALDENCCCEIPPSMLNSLTFEVGLYSDGFATSTVKVAVTPSVLEAEGFLLNEENAPSQYEQILEIVNSVETVENAVVNEENNLIIALSSGAQINAGYVKGEKGDTGEKGEKGERFTYEDFTPEQLEGLKHVRFDGGYVDEAGFLHLTLDECEIENFSPFFVGFGSGGSANETELYNITVKNLLENRSIVSAYGNSVVLKFSYLSVDEEGYDDGNGALTVYVDGIEKLNKEVSQGENTLDVTQYLSAGSHNLKLVFSNSEGSKRALAYSVELVSLSLSTTLDEMASYSSDVTFYYTPFGSGEKTVYFLMDGEIIGTQTVSSEGRSLSFVVPSQSHGAHVFQCYAETEVEDVTIRSNVLTLGMMFLLEGNIKPSVLSLFEKDEAIQGEALEISFLAVDPLSETADVTLEVISDEKVYFSKKITVSRKVEVWNISDYPLGKVTFKITCAEASFSKEISVLNSEILFSPVTDSLLLDFSAENRSNSEENPAVWKDENYSAEFSNISFSEKDGWISDESGCNALRILPGGKMTIPVKLFETDRRNTGFTVEIEMATHNVADYNSVVISCFSGERGLKIASQNASFVSEQSEISMQFKENSRVRLSFVAEAKNQNRMLYVFVDGIMCGAVRYSESDNFAQSEAVGITVGAESCGIDLYRLSLYEKGLSSYEALDNFICNRPTLSERVEAYKRNDILDSALNIVPSKLPKNLPYLIITCDELPKTKGDKKTCSLSFVDPSHSEKSFKANGVEIDVQGTSSAGYRVKNFKFSLKNGLTFSKSGETKENFAMNENAVAVSTFCLKADVASSEGANNVELVKLYEDICPFKTAAQTLDPKVRQGIDGFPIVVFFQKKNTSDLSFCGKYNFNNDKSTAEVFGLNEDNESWEIKNNTSDRCLFKSSDFSSGVSDDFEARYPEKSEDYSNLEAMVSWVASTERKAEDSEEEKQRKLSLFKEGFETYFHKEAWIFYYVFTEAFLMVDSRAKNLFPSLVDGKWMPLPYDFDTALGINNEGRLVFDYNLEDSDSFEGDFVFNGAQSVLWCNLRDCFGEEISQMYKTLRGGDVFNFEEIENRFSSHQAVWPEAVWNEDAFVKYTSPFFSDNDASGLSMLQGSKSAQRKWWLSNRLKYLDSKYQTALSEENYITLRCYEVGDITIKPYSHIYPRIKFGSHTVTARAQRNEAVTLKNPLDTMSDTEVYIYSSDCLSEIGDLSALMVGYADFSMAPKLRKLKLGSSEEGYQNQKLKELYVGNSELLSEVDIQNCVSLKQSLDFSACSCLKTLKAFNSAITAASFAKGGKLETLEMPESLTNLTLIDLKELKNISLQGASSLTTLRCENTSNIPLDSIISAAPLERVRLVGMSWNCESQEVLKSCIEKLEKCGGLDISGENTEKAVVSGVIYVPEISAELLDRIYSAFPLVTVVVGGKAEYLIRYLNEDGSLLYSYCASEGEAVIDPVAEKLIEAPKKEATEDYSYLFVSFGELDEKVNKNLTYVAEYETLYAVRFYNEDEVIHTQYVAFGADATEPVAAGYISEPQKESTQALEYSFSGWQESLEKIEGVSEIHAVFSEKARKYTVNFYNGETLLQTSLVEYGSVAQYEGETPQYTAVSDPENYPFVSWDKELVAIEGDTDYHAVFKMPSGTCGEGVYWSLDLESGVLTISGEGEIEENSFTPSLSFYDYKDKIISAVVESGITATGLYLFNKLQNLESIRLGDDVSVVENYLVYKCPALKSIHLGKSVPTLTSQWIYDTPSLAEITVDENNPYLSNDEYGVLFNKTKTVLIKFPVGSPLESYAVPDGTSTIEKSSFYCAVLKNVTIPDSVSFIGSAAFYKCLSMVQYDFSSWTDLPTLEYSDAFSNIPSTTKMLVTQEIYDLAANTAKWSGFVSNMQVAQ